MSDLTPGTTVVSPKPAIKLSATVIVTTRNRAADLRRILPSLLQLTYDPLEVIIVVGPSEDDTDDVVEPYRDRMKIVRSPAANMCLSRNLGLLQAAGDVVIFIDDDGMPATRAWVDALVEPFAREERVGAAGGPVLLRDTDTWQFRRGAVSAYGEHVFVSGEVEGQQTAATPAGWFARAMGTNAAFRRDALLAIGGFDERITYYGDECDVCVRLARRGYTFAFVEAAAVRHYPAPSLHRHLIDRTQVVTHDDTYFCLRGTQASWPIRFVTTARKAAAKHYVAEVLAARRAGRLQPGEFFRFVHLWSRGFGRAVAESLFTTRRLLAERDVSAAAPALRPLTRVTPARRLTVGLASRSLPCDGPCEGPARYTWDLAHALHALGHDVHLFGESPIRTRHLALGLTVHGIGPEDLTESPFPSHPTLNRTVAYGLAVADRVRALRQTGITFDVVHATNWNAEAVGLLLDGQVPVVMMLVTSLAEVIEYGQWTRNDDLDACVWLDRAQMLAAAALTAPTSGLTQKYLETGLIDAGLAARVMPAALGIAPQSIAPRSIAAATAADRDGRTPRHRILFVGTHVRRKGLDDLLAVLPALLAAHEDWGCDIAGDDTRIVDEGLTLRAQFLRDHARAPWLSRVTFHGRVADDALWRLYAGASLYVVPSRFESFGLTYLEAMQFGVPVVATHTGGIPEVVRDGEAGLLVPVDDRTALKEAVGRLMRDGPLREAMGRAAHADVQARWTHVHMAQRLLPIYEKAIDAHRHARADRGSDSRADSNEASRTRSDRRVDAVLDLIVRAGAPEWLVTRLHEAAATLDSSRDGKALLVAAAMGCLPSAALYLEAIETCLERGDAARAAQLAVDGGQHAPDLTTEIAAQFADTAWVAVRLAQGDSLLDPRPAVRVSTPAAATGPGAPPAFRRSLLEDALAQARTVRALVPLAAFATDARLPAAERLLARYHLGSVLKRCSFSDEAMRTLRALTSDPGFSRLTTEVRAASWFHLADLLRAAGRLDEAEAGFSRCLELNPGHRRAAALREELRQRPAAIPVGRAS
jgi:glycogen synthase